MRTIENTLIEEKYQLGKVIAEAKERVKTAPKGRLRIRKWKGVVEYYYNENSDTGKNVITGKCSNTNGRYIKKSERKLAKEIAQRDYDVLMIKNAEIRIKAIDTFLDKYDETSLKLLYQKINPYRRELITAPIISDDEFIKRWQKVEYSGKYFKEDAQEIITERGERVRSKSEKIIADKLYLLGIPYRYEYPLVLNGNIKVYPDFTILRMPEREEVYLEHLGMMDDNNYVDTVIYKLNTYERNGIYLGVNLYITHETKKNPLNTRMLDKLLKKLFCEEC